jgi:hypothetical protein
MQWLVAHERALVEILHLEHVQPHARASLAPLEALLASAS